MQSDDQSYLSAATYMCLLLSRIPILKDMRLANRAEGGHKDGEGEGEDTRRAAAGDGDGRKTEEDSMTYDEKEDDFSYAGVYDECF